MFDREILVRLAGLGVQVQILLPENMPTEVIPGWDIYRTSRHHWNYYEYNWIFLWRILDLSRNPRFDLLRVHSPTLSPLGWTYKRLTGLPVTAHIHHLGENLVAGWMNRLFINHYELITTDSIFSRQQLIDRYHLPEERIRITSPGVSEKFCPQPVDERLKAQLGVAGTPVLFYLGSFIPRKNLLFLLESFAIVHEKNTGVRLVMAGGGPQERSLKERAEQLGLSAFVIFTGPLSEGEKVAFHNLADIFVLPSLLEGFGMVAAEAMACGKPVVAANAASLPEVVADGQTGYLADPRRKEDFAAKILRLLQDEPLRKQMGQAGIERVRSLFSWDRSAQVIKNAYEKISVG